MYIYKPKLINNIMAVNLGGFEGQAAGLLGGVINVFIWVIGIIVAFAVLGIILFFRKRAGQYNIPVTIWIPRSDGKVMDEFDAKGGYFVSKNNITSFRLLRKKLPVVDIPPPSSRFLVGLRRKLYLIQKGMDDFEPVLPESFRYVQTETGAKKLIPVINLKCINQDATAWVEDNRENAKRRFSFLVLWEKYKDFIQITIFVFIVMLSIYINWQGLADVATALENVATHLAGKPIVS